jgi:hypothetical protein
MLHWSIILIVSEETVLFLVGLISCYFLPVSSRGVAEI